MLFNSLTFLIFFTIVYSLYLLTQKNLMLQNRMLLVASCIFYGWWDWRFLGLMWFTIIVDYFMAILIHRSEDEKKRKTLLAISIVCNMSVLGFFKYFNFFEANFVSLLNAFGMHAQPTFLKVILPIGVSFYTFQSMSYTIDVYRKELMPAHHLLDFAVFVTFFPHLVAGPILRATKLLPQVLSPRVIKREQIYEGTYLIFWGLFQKMFVADNLARFVDPYFASAGPYNGVAVLLAVYAFAFQILCDFAGYSDIARGLGKLMGFDIIVNFNLPYFSKNPSEFWQRWHISLSSWLRDYLYIPLGGNRKGTWTTYRNLILVMLLGGLWHGAAWGFVIWGAYHGFLLILHRMLKPALEKMTFPEGSLEARIWLVVRIVIFFHLVCLGWLFFRAHSASQAFEMFAAVFAYFQPSPDLIPLLLNLLYFTFFLLCVQIYQYRKDDLLALGRLKPGLKLSLGLMALYSFLYAEIMVSSVNQGGAHEFIYFQF